MMAMVSDVLARRSQSSLLGPAARPALNTDQVREFYAAMAKRKSIASGSELTSRSSSPPSEGGGYISSVHLGGAGPPSSAGGDGLYHDVRPFVPRHFPQLPEDQLTDLTRKQFNKRRERRELDELLDRIAQKTRGVK